MTSRHDNDAIDDSDLRGHVDDRQQRTAIDAFNRPPSDTPDRGSSEDDLQASSRPSVVRLLRSVPALDDIGAAIATIRSASGRRRVGDQLREHLRPVVQHCTALLYVSLRIGVAYALMAVVLEATNSLEQLRFAAGAIFALVIGWQYVALTFSLLVRDVTSMGDLVGRVQARKVSVLTTTTALALALLGGFHIVSAAIAVTTMIQLSIPSIARRLRRPVRVVTLTMAGVFLLVAPVYYYLTFPYDYPSIAFAISGTVIAMSASYDFTDAHLEGSRLRRSSFDESVLVSIAMDGVYAPESSFYESAATDASFRSADLRGSYFGWSELNEAEFDGATLDESYFYGARLESTSFRRTSMKDAAFTDENSLSGEVLGSELIGCDFSGADLSGADFRNARFRNVSFHGANVRTVRLSGATFDAVTASPETEWPSDFSPEDHGIAIVQP